MTKQDLERQRLKTLLAMSESQAPDKPMPRFFELLGYVEKFDNN